jgi:uncharacterized membrane protein
MYRRRLLPAEDRFRLPVRRWLRAVHAEMFEPDSGREAVLNVLLVVGVLLTAASVGYALGTPTDDETFTELYLLTESGEDLTAGAYPTNLTVGEPSPVVVGVHNREHRRTNYTVVVGLQRLDRAGNDTRVRETRTLDRYRTTLSHNETRLTTVDVTPTTTGERLRVVFLLYRGTPPADPGTENAYRWTSLYVDVSDAG